MKWMSGLLLLVVQVRAVQAAGADLPLPANATQPASQPIDKKLKQEEKRAELTPIVPSPHDLSKPAYQLYWQLDVPVLGIGAGLAIARFLRTQPAYCAPLCDKTTLNPIDRLTAGFYDPKIALASDIGLYSVIGGSILLIMIDEGFWPGLNDLVVVAETALTATSLAELATLAAARPRPYEYGTKAPLSLRNTADAGMSFISGHATLVFSVAVSTFMTMRRLHPKKRALIPIVTVLVGLSAATFVASCRVLAGMHFITDALGGALIGSAVGILVPSLHGSPVRVVPQILNNGNTVNGGALNITFTL